ncbi:MAG: hypothetical protein HY701_10900, partial [Gemmatimonadetes bacterium]|nr:hypothetical protein [Gemmatimonadota bacterium]
MFCSVTVWGGQQLGVRSTVVRDVTVISGTGLPAMPDMAIVITGARIAVVDRADRVQIPAGARIIEG